MDLPSIKFSNCFFAAICASGHQCIRWYWIPPFNYSVSKAVFHFLIYCQNFIWMIILQEREGNSPLYSIPLSPLWETGGRVYWNGILQQHVASCCTTENVTVLWDVLESTPMSMVEPRVSTEAVAWLPVTQLKVTLPIDGCCINPSQIPHCPMPLQVLPPERS